MKKWYLVHHGFGAYVTDKKVADPNCVVIRISADQAATILLCEQRAQFAESVHASEKILPIEEGAFEDEEVEVDF